jgi:1-acyl-sn-glycerol-3-phosphate acyltransferase
VTIPAVVAALAIITAALPLLILAALVVDVVRGARRSSFASLRLVVFAEAFLFVEALGLVLLGLTWLVTLGSTERRRARTWAVQAFYTGSLFKVARALYALRFEVEGDALAAEAGPLLVLVRHESLIDVLIPAVFVANRHGVHLRYVLKRELLMGPCLDVAGHFLPNAFVARDGSDTPREVAQVRALKTGIGERDGVILYPEGTRFTERKRARALDRLTGEARDRAERLRNLLPVRPGGVLALLDEAPACDVLFVGHSGLRGFAELGDIWRGALVGATIRVKMWRAPAASIPETGEARLAWLNDRWQRIDDWLSAPAPTGDAAEPPATEAQVA